MSTLVDVLTAWNGETSDLARQYYRLHVQNQTVPQRIYAGIPDAVKQRLNATGTVFDELPGLLQRALLWDTGYVENGNFNGDDGKPIPLVRVQTLNGISMADIAVTPEAYTEACDIRTCVASGYNWYKTKACESRAALTTSRCLVDVYENPGSTPTGLWSFRGDDTMVPAMRLLRHAWGNKNNSKIWNEVSSIHTSPANIEPVFGECAYNPTNPSQSPGSLVIPCELSNANSTISPGKRSSMKPPKQSEFVTKWLTQYAQTTVSSPTSNGLPTTSTASESPRSPSTTLSPVPAATQEKSNSFNPISVIAPVVAVVLTVIGVLIWRRRRRKQAGVNVESPKLPEHFQPSPERSNVMWYGSSSVRTGTGNSVNPAIPSTASSSLHGSNYSYDGSEVQTAYQAVVDRLLDDVRMAEKRVPYDQLEFVNQISAGAFGEVWVGYCNRELVAIKRLLRTRRQSVGYVEAFAYEIQLSARLHHPNIVRFVGMSWNRPEDLCLVIEFLPAGDLTKVLSENGGHLTWSQHKLSMARGLASAIAYLHAKSPAIIHRDLKSKNVLLTNTLEPKIVDFGVSRRMMDDTMTAGVGTPFWTAPEVLEGLRYTEKSDIYSLGVLLTELDTCQIPYADVSNDSGRMVHFKILKQVVSGQLRPTMTESCPDVIRKVVVSCLRQDPATRPTAAEVLFMLA